MNKKIFIFGITGQDGSYLAHYLLSKNFTVYGFTRSKEKSNLKNLIKLKILKKVILFKFTQLNLKFVEKKILKFNPCQIYILSGLSSVAKSFERPIEAYESIIIPVFNSNQDIIRYQHDLFIKNKWAEFVKAKKKTLDFTKQEVILSETKVGEDIKIKKPILSLKDFINYG